MGDPAKKQLQDNQSSDTVADSSDGLAPGKRPLTTPSRGNGTDTPGKRSGTQDLKPGSPEERGGRAPKGSGKTAAPAGGGGAGAGGKVTAGGAKSAGGGGGGAAASFGAGGGVLGDGIKAQLTQFNTTVKGNADSVQQPPGTGGSPKKDSEEDHAKKVAQYEDGVDGIADMIGDLDAFDDLCSAFGGTFSDPDPSAQQAALNKIRGSKPFHNLAQMWQGALDGGPDSEKMQQVFERQFTGRGFFGSTEKAYALVRDDAKRQAKQDADAAAAAKKAKAAKAKAEKDAQDAADKAAGKTNAAAGSAKAIDGGAGGAASVAGLNAVVPADMTPIAGFAEFSKVTDADFGHLMANADTHAGLFAENAKEGQFSRRNDQILEQLKEAGGGFKEGFIDTAKWGIVAHFGDKVAGGAAEKLLGEKVPIVGPIIMIAMDPPWKGSYWSGKGSVSDKLGTGAHDIAHAFNMDAFKSCHSAGDVVGVLCAKLADLFSGFQEILSVISRLVNTLSALCLILGAVLIGVGCALAWLGIGAGLIAAGGWLVEAGEVLGDIGLALMPICLALSAIALVFRTAAAYMVPADVYAEQLAAEGGAADEFGKQAGTRVGLATARAVEEATPNAPKPVTANDAAAGGGAAKTEGAAEAKQVEASTKATGDAMQKVADSAPKAKEGGGTHEAPKQEPVEHAEPKAEQKPEVEHPADEAKAKDEAKEKGEEKEKEGEGDEHEKEGEEKDEGDENDKADDAKEKSVGRKFVESLGHQLVEAVKTSASLGRNLGRLGEAVKGLGRLSDVKTASRRGLARHIEGLEKSLSNAEPKIKELNEKAAAHEEAMNAALDELVQGEGKLSKAEVDKLNKQVRESEAAWADAKTKADNLKETLEGAVADAKEGAKHERMPDEEEREGSSAEDEDGSPHSAEEKLRKAEDELKETKGELKKIKKENAQLEKEVADARTALESAKAEKAHADAEQAEAAKDPANKEKVEASKQVAEHDAAMARAQELAEKSGRIKSAEARRKVSEGALKKTIGKPCEVGGEPHKITAFGPDGVTVEPAAGGPAKTVKPAEVKGAELPSDFQAQAEKLAKAKTDLATEMGDEKAPAGDYANRLEQNANRIRAEEGKRYSTPKKQAKWAQTKKAAAEWDAPGKKSASEVEEAQKELDAKQEEAADKRHEQEKLEDEAKDLDNETARLRRAKSDHRRTEQQMEKGAELMSIVLSLDHKLGMVFEAGWDLPMMALGALYTKAKALITGHQEGEDKHDKYAVLGMDGEGEEKKAGEEKTADAKKEQPDEEGSADDKKPTEPGADAKAADGKKPDDKAKEPEEKKEAEGEENREAELEKVKEEAQKSGAKEAMFEALLALRPPQDIALLGDHRKRAGEAAVKAKDSHAWAHKCYQAELEVTRLAEQSQQMAESGKPMHKRAQEMKAPIEKSKGDERDRASGLGGAEPGDIKGADPQMGGLVVQLISKLADHSDRLSQKPDAGGVKGEDMAGSQDKASQEGAQRSQQSKSHSSAQQQFLDQALELRARQEASVAKNIQSLEGKSREELSIRDQIRQHKAQALADEAQARGEAEAEAAIFNEGWSRASTWQEAFEAKRKAMKETGGGE